ncbi:MAG: Lactonase, 7-bladed beta-propeller [Armatimonadota bacterium]
MTTIADIRLLSQRKARGTYAIHPNAISDDGCLTVAVPDDYEVRVLHFTRHDSAERPSVIDTVSVETLRSLQLSPDGSVGIGITDDDFYIFNSGRKSRFLTDRRLAYHSVALAGNTRFAYVASDILMHGYAVGLGDSSNRLLWTKDLQQPTELVAISPNGKFLAVAGTAGEVLVLTDTRDTLVTVHSGLFPIGICIDNDATMAIVGRDMLDNQVKTKVTDRAGEYQLVANVDGDPCGIAVLPGGNMVAIATVVDAKSGKVVFIGNVPGGDDWELLIDAGCPSGVALSPCGSYLAVSTRDGAIYRFEVDSMIKSGFSEQNALDDFRKQLASGDIPGALLGFCGKWVRNQTSGFTDIAQIVAQDLAAALDDLTIHQLVDVFIQISGQPIKIILPEIFTKAISVATTTLIQQTVMSPSATVAEQLDLLASIHAVTVHIVLGQDVADVLGEFRDTVSARVYQEMSAAINGGNLDRASQLAVQASHSGIVGGAIHELHVKVNLERTLQDANIRYDAKDFSGALFGYRKVLRWLPDNREIRARVQFAEAMISDSGLQDRFSRLE